MERKYTNEGIPIVEPETIKEFGSYMIKNAREMKSKFKEWFKEVHEENPLVGAYILQSMITNCPSDEGMIGLYKLLKNQEEKNKTKSNGREFIVKLEIDRR